MNEWRIKNYVDDIFREVVPGDRVTERKEELAANITQRIRDYMGDGLSFDAAFDTARGDLGDTGELTAPFEKTVPAYAGYDPQRPPLDYAAPARDEPKRGNIKISFGSSRIKISFGWGLVAMSPFIYVFIGLLQNQIGAFVPFWDYFGINWWAWGWIIIPGSAILCSPIKWTHKLVALSPFIYLLLGFWFGMWAFGWIIIPLAACLEAGGIKITRE
jgi:hypothetical protein